MTGNVHWQREFAQEKQLSKPCPGPASDTDPLDIGITDQSVESAQSIQSIPSIKSIPSSESIKTNRYMSALMSAESAEWMEDVQTQTKTQKQRETDKQTIKQNQIQKQNSTNQAYDVCSMKPSAPAGNFWFVVLSAQAQLQLNFSSFFSTSFNQSFIISYYKYSLIMTLYNKYLILN